MKKDRKKERISRKQTRKYLRTLTRDAGVHPFRNTTRVMKYGFSGFGRNIWLSLASILVMTITLIILIISVLSNIILGETATALRDRIDITIFLKPETTDTTLKNLTEILTQDNNVKVDTIIANNSTAEVAVYLEENADEEDMIEMVNSDPEMYAIFVKNMPATIRFKVRDVDNIDSIKSLVSSNELFKDSLHEDHEKYSPTYDMNQAEIKTINSWARIAKNGGIILGIIFLLISVLIIFNTVRMAVFSRREEIYMMKLIGGSKSFIRGPFLVEAALSGLISGLLASFITYYGFAFLAPRLEKYGINVATITGYYDEPILLTIFIGIITVIGIFIGIISARLAAQKYLKKL